MRFQAAAATHIGCVRETHQDAFLISEHPEVYAVADGMGGLAYGEVASRFAIDQLKADAPFIANEEDLRAALESLGTRIHKAGEILSPGIGIGTTLTLAIPQEERTLLVAHIGDSQLYCLNEEHGLMQLTQDHTLWEKTLQEKPHIDTTRLPPHYAHTLTRCLGQRPVPQFDFFLHPIKFQDRYLLCSDGIGKVIPTDEIQKLMQTAPSPKALADLLIVRALKHGGPDNATAVAFFTGPPVTGG